MVSGYQLSNFSHQLLSSTTFDWARFTLSASARPPAQNCCLVSMITGLWSTEFIRKIKDQRRNDQDQDQHPGDTSLAGTPVMALSPYLIHGKSHGCCIFRVETTNITRLT